MVFRYRFVFGSPLYHLLSGIPNTPICDPCGAYRVSEILYGFFRYIGVHQLYVGPYTVACNNYLEILLGVATFQIDQVYDLISPWLTKIKVYSIGGKQTDQFIIQGEMCMVEILIRKGNTLRLDDVA